MNKYDSRPDTYEHINNVRHYINKIIHKLLNRAEKHDASKLVSPEVEYFDELTPKLKQTTYLSDEYKQFLTELEPALIHHYAKNSHHPQHYPNGIKGMNLLDIIEMFCDWKAATMRHDDGNLIKSIELNQQRFDFSDELKQIFLNTISVLDD